MLNRRSITAVMPPSTRIPSTDRSTTDFQRTTSGQSITFHLFLPALAGEKSDKDPAPQAHHFKVRFRPSQSHSTQISPDNLPAYQALSGANPPDRRSHDAAPSGPRRLRFPLLLRRIRRLVLPLFPETLDPSVPVLRTRRFPELVE